MEDAEGSIAHVSVYKYPFTLDASRDETDAIFTLGARIAIREPTYKLTANGSRPMIRVDSPSDIVFMDDAFLNLDLPVPLKSFCTPTYVRSVTKSVEEWKEIGAQAFKKGQCFLAAIAFSEGLKDDPTNHVLVLNRIECYLRIGWFNSALSEARWSLTFDSLPSALRLKAVGRAARACYAMGEYDDAIMFAEMLSGAEELAKIVRSCHDRKRERAEGKFDWDKLYRLSLESPFRPDIANYTGAVEVQPSEKLKGHRGVFVTRDVEAGELLVSQTCIFFSTSLMLYRSSRGLSRRVLKRMGRQCKCYLRSIS